MSVVYNVTFGVDKDIEREWLSWMKDVHIPDVMRTGKFSSNKIYKVMGQEDMETTSFAIQYFADGPKEVNDYLNDHAPALRAEVHQKFGDKQMAYRTLLEEV